jgi:hypothetical protein
VKWGWKMESSELFPRWVLYLPFGVFLSSPCQQGLAVMSLPRRRRQRSGRSLVQADSGRNV